MKLYHYPRGRPDRTAGGGLHAGGGAAAAVAGLEPDVVVDRDGKAGDRRNGSRGDLILEHGCTSRSEWLARVSFD